jgi:hypothetical protein
MIALTSKSENHSCATILSSASPLFSIEKPPEKPDHPIQKEKTTIRILPVGSALLTARRPCRGKATVFSGVLFVVNTATKTPPMLARCEVKSVER